MKISFNEKDVRERKGFIETLFELKNSRPGIVYLEEVNMGDFGVDDILLCKELMLLRQLKEFEKKSKVQVQDDYIPIISTDLGTAIFPSAFGAKVDFFPHTMPWAHPIFSDAKEVYSLPEPSHRAGLLERVLEYTSYFQETTNYKYPIRVTDIQGPLDVAYLIWNNEDFMYAMYTHSKEVHHLLKKVTDLIINFVKLQKNLVKTEFVPLHFPPFYMPDGLGIGVSEDASAFIGPSQYKEYAIPYLNCLSEEFGGIFIHSCGNFSHNLDNLAQVYKLRGIDFGVTEIPFNNVLKVFDNKIVISARVGLNKEFNPFTNYIEYIDFVLQHKRDPRGLMIQIWRNTTDKNLEVHWDDKYYQEIEERILNLKGE